MKKYFYSIDVGGTTTKGGIVDENNNLLFCDTINTTTDSKSNSLAGCILSLIERLEQLSNLRINNSAGLGIGIPGEIDAQNGIVSVSNNLKLFEYPIIKLLKQHIKVPVKIANDANLATLAEAKEGAGKNFKNFVMLTLGTGIGGDFFVNGEPYSKYSPFSGEFGHIKISATHNNKCACGEYNCFEVLASTKALANQTKRAMLKNKNSLMWKTYDENSICGKTVFDYLGKDVTADKVFKTFIEYLGTGIVSIVNLLMPEAVIIGGSISNQGQVLTKPLERFVNSHIYAKSIKNYHIKILPANLGANAGILGGKYLFD